MFNGVGGPGSATASSTQNIGKIKASVFQIYDSLNVPNPMQEKKRGGSNSVKRRQIRSFANLNNNDNANDKDLVDDLTTPTGKLGLQKMLGQTKKEIGKYIKEIYE